jgi:hypothetical protein
VNIIYQLFRIIECFILRKGQIMLTDPCETCLLKSSSSSCDCSRCNARSADGRYV